MTFSRSTTRSIISTVSILLGTIIGAGFASGQELVTFFIRYGSSGLYGLAASGIIWILAFHAVFYVIRKDRIHSYSELTDILFGHEIGLIYQILVAIFMFLSLAIMISGAGTLLHEQWHIPRLYGTLGMAVMIYITMCYGGRGLSIMNSVLAPLLVIGILLAAVIILQDRSVSSAVLCLEPVQTLSISDSPVLQVILQTLLYVSYNLISVIVIYSGIIVPYPRHISWITGILLSLLSLSLGVATFINYGTIIEIEIPIPALLTHHPGFRWMYAAILFMAMYTTAIGNAYGCLEFLKKTSKLQLLFVIIGAVLASGLGFTTLIDKGYTFFGYIGLLQLFLILRRAVYHRRIDGHL